MTAADAKKNYLVGVEFDSPHETGGYFDFQRRATLREVAAEMLDIIRNGHSFPAFPPSANPRLMFAFCLKDDREIDCKKELQILIKEIA